MEVFEEDGTELSELRIDLADESPVWMGHSTEDVHGASPSGGERPYTEMEARRISEPDKRPSTGSISDSVNRAGTAMRRALEDRKAREKRREHRERQSDLAKRHRRNKLRADIDGQRDPEDSDEAVCNGKSTSPTLAASPWHVTSVIDSPVAFIGDKPMRDGFLDLSPSHPHDVAESDQSPKPPTISEADSTEVSLWRCITPSRSGAGSRTPEASSPISVRSCDFRRAIKHRFGSTTMRGPWSPLLMVDMEELHRLRSFYSRDLEETKGKGCPFSDSPGRRAAGLVTGLRQSMVHIEGWNMRRKEASQHKEKLLLELDSAARPCRDALRDFLLVVIALLLLVTVLMGNAVGESFMAFKYPKTLGSPDHLPLFFSGQCTHLVGTFGHHLDALEAFNWQNGWAEISFPARDFHNVSALYFPSSPNSPLVIVAHSLSATWLDHTVQTAAYFLRSMGVSVLIPNLNGRWSEARFGFWGASEGVGPLLQATRSSWDLQAALDFAAPSHVAVGVLGFEYGALPAMVAFGQDPRIAGVMLDGGVQDTRRLMGWWLRQRFWLSWLLLQQAWARCEWVSQMKLDPDPAIVDLLASRAEGFVGIVHSEDDEVVPLEQRDILLESLSPGFNTTWQWYPSFHSEHCARRRAIHLDRPDEYRGFLCSFWSRVFDGEDSSRCSNQPPAPWGSLGR